MRLIKGLLICLFIFIGIFLVANVDKGVQHQELDKVNVELTHKAALDGVTLQTVTDSVPDTHVADSNLVTVPFGQVAEYVQKLKSNEYVMDAKPVAMEPPTFAFKAYVYGLKQQINQFASGDIGTITYKSNPSRAYPVSNLLPDMVVRSLSYLIPGFLLSLVLGYGLALTAAWKPRVGRVMDRLHALLLALPDFLLLVLFQFVAILLAKLAGHNVVLIMQFAGDIPLLIPLLTVSIMPALLLYGTLRIAVEREWQADYIKTAYSKGLTSTATLLYHILRNTTADVLAVLPRAVTVSITALVMSEVMCGIFGLGGYALNEKLVLVTSLPTTCGILACFALLAHGILFLLQKMLIVNTKEGA
ncbi:ABC transporter permease subunit [Tumebacillus sp. ITR2]|uniref:ABC transporter permease subunit n=1 Tax=Tumebacillus amylolyticus TaxID=2801339 RepID=A0ABS1JDF2_9BACL|nr:ABC transporter permease subunit [Tumebacillus amylolyticus]MBL0388235.1 ABC transporter permease subunit [Tumebacillus amylolyticus]